MRGPAVRGLEVTSAIADEPQREETITLKNRRGAENSPDPPRNMGNAGGVREGSLGNPGSRE